jgi:DNA-binding NtrC family response regulator
VVLQETLLPGEGEETDGRPGEAAPDRPAHPLPRGRRAALDAFERQYVEALLQLHGGKVSQAAASADIDRVHLYR